MVGAVPLPRQPRCNPDSRAARPGRRNDRRGELAEDALIEALAERRPPGGPDAIGLDALVVALVDQHIDPLAEDGRAIRTVDMYRYAAKLLAKMCRCPGRGVHAGPR